MSEGSGNTERPAWRYASPFGGGFFVGPLVVVFVIAAVSYNVFVREPRIRDRESARDSLRALGADRWAEGPDLEAWTSSVFSGSPDCYCRLRVKPGEQAEFVQAIKTAYVGEVTALSSQCWPGSMPAEQVEWWDVARNDDLECMTLLHGTGPRAAAGYVGLSRATGQVYVELLGH